jgi:fibro-slime domain-containing protein
MRLLYALALLPFFACGSEGSEFGDKNGGGSQSSSGGPFGGADAGGAGDGGDGCHPSLIGLVRDFRGYRQPNDGPLIPGGHPDFEMFSGAATGLVESQLGPDRKPVFRSKRGSADSDVLTGKTEFDQWYRNVDGVNQAFEFDLPLKPAGGVLTYDNEYFFPIDGRGFGNTCCDRQATPVERNFHFTFELHLEFVYRGGETFKFLGDDDLWAFFNGKLGVDLGGVHGALEGSFDLDAKAREYGLTKGGKYPLDVFHAERHTRSSKFRIDTTLEFVNCDKIILLR